MFTLTAAKIQKLSNELDIFFNNCIPDRKLIKQRLYPPLPVYKNTLVWGFHIVREALKMGIEEFPCMETAGAPCDLLCIALKLENRCNYFSWKEKESVLEFITKNGCLDREKEISLLIQTEGSFIPNTVKFISLNSYFKKAVNSNNLDIKTAETIHNIPENVYSIFSEKSACFSFSIKRKMLLFLSETAARDMLSNSALYELTEKILTSCDPYKEIYKTRYPELSNMEDTFTKIKNNYLKGTGIQLKAPPGFEGDAFTVSFPFRNKKQLTRIIEQLKILEEADEELFSLL